MGQAEHGPTSPAILVTNSEELARKTIKEVDRQLKVLPTAAIAEKAWADYGQVILCETEAEMLEVSNEIACEHVQVMPQNPNYFLEI